MRKEKPMGADELMKKLENDQEYQAMRKRKDQELKEHQKVLAEDEKNLIEDLKEQGYEVNSVWDFVNNNNRYEFLRQFDGDYVNAYPILVKHLDEEHHPRVREGIIRALTIKDGGIEVENALLEEFNKERDPNIKWVLANALKTAMPYYRRKKIPEIAEVYKNAQST